MTNFTGMDWSEEDKFVAEVLSLYSTQTGKDTNTLIEETLYEKALFLAPNMYAIETVKQMDLACKALERLKAVGVTTNLEALMALNKEYKRALKRCAPWLVKESDEKLEESPNSNDYMDGVYAGEFDDESPVEFYDEAEAQREPTRSLDSDSVKNLIEQIRRGLRGDSH